MSCRYQLSAKFGDRNRLDLEVLRLIKTYLRARVIGTETYRSVIVMFLSSGN